jgi:hypothetical protein
MGFMGRAKTDFTRPIKLLFANKFQTYFRPEKLFTRRRNFFRPNIYLLIAPAAIMIDGLYIRPVTIRPLVWRSPDIIIACGEGGRARRVAWIAAAIIDIKIILRASRG